LNFAIFRNALLPEVDLGEWVTTFVPDVEIEETWIPLGAVAVEWKLYAGI
jgi:hypothetical protein